MATMPLFDLARQKRTPHHWRFRVSVRTNKKPKTQNTSIYILIHSIKYDAPPLDQLHWFPIVHHHYQHVFCRCFQEKDSKVSPNHMFQET